MSALFKKYCRFCAEQKTDAELLDVSIYSQVKDEIKEKLSFFNVGLSIDLSHNNMLPTTVCSSCRGSLDDAHAFLLRLRRSQAVLRQVFKDNLTKIDKDSECRLYAGLTIEVKAETPLEPEYKIASENTDSKNESHPFLDKDFFETSVVIEVKAETPLEGEPEYKIAPKNSHPENESHPFLDKDFSETSSVVDEQSSSDNEVLTYMGVPIFEQDTSLKVMGNGTKGDKSWTSLQWGCQYCDLCFADVNLLREHSKKIHDLCSAFKCADCKDTFSYFGVFVEHVTGHRKSLRNYCPYCNLKVEPSLLTKHTAEHKLKESICERCGKIFDNKYYLGNHNTKYKPLKRKLDNIKNPTKRRNRCPTKNPYIYVVPQCRIEEIEDKSWNGYPWTCQTCKSEFSDTLILRAHIREVHGKCFAMKCVDCNDIMESYTGFAYHARRHRPFLKKYCHYCNYKFKENEQEKDHISQHFAISDRLCEGCGEIFADENSYRQHVTTYDPPKPSKHPFRREKPHSIDELTCDICYTLLNSRDSLRSHKRRHTERNKEFTCDRCGKAFHNKTRLHAHYITHKEPQEVCKICNRTFKTVSLLKQHVFRHTGDKPFECDVCKKRFGQKNNLTEHLKVHTDEAPFKCSYCDKTFKYKSNAKSHEHQHTGARPYQCTHCEMDFTDSGNRNKHMRRKHGYVADSKRLRGKLSANEDLKAVKEWTEKILVKKGNTKKDK